MAANRSTGGGAATHAGTNYQNRVAAWTVVHILAEEDATAPWDLPPTITLEAIHAEAPRSVDDLNVTTAADGCVLAQAKHTLTLETTPASDLAGTIGQFVAEYRNAVLNPEKDRLVLVTSSRSCAPIKTHIPAFLNRLRSSANPTAEWTAGSQEEQRAAGIVRAHLMRAWHDAAGADPTPEEFVGLLRLVRIHILDVDVGERDEREAKDMLRRSVLANPTDADLAWSTLITATATYATNHQQADRAALQRALTVTGITLRAARSFRTDIDRLREHTIATIQTLQEFSRIHFGQQIITITRAATDDLQAAVCEGHLLVLGLPGAGKSGALYNLATALLAQHSDVVVFAVDQHDAASTGTLRAELNLTHELITVLAAWPGNGPAYLLIDALDAARTEAAANTLQAIIRAVIATNSRWHVVASVRKWDLRYNPTLQCLFGGTPPSTTYTDEEFPKTRHVSIPALSDTELAQMRQASPAMAPSSTAPQEHCGSFSTSRSTCGSSPICSEWGSAQQRSSLSEHR